MQLSNRIKKLREAANMDREILAEGVVSYSHLSNIEIGRFVPSNDILIALAKKLEIPKDYLLKYKEIDQELEEFLLSLKRQIDTFQLEEAKKVLNKIEAEYPIIHSIYQETFYYALKSYYLFKMGYMDKAIQVLQKEVLPLMKNVDIEPLPELFKEVYFYLLALYYFHNENYHASYQYFIKLLPIVKESLLRATINYNIALTLIRMNNSHNAITFAKAALTIFLHDRFWDKAAETDNLLGVIYWELHDISKAEKHLTSALEMVKQYDLDELEPKIYHNLGLVSIEKKAIEQGKELLTKSLKLKQAKNNHQNQVSTYVALSEIYLNQGLIAEAKKMLLEGKMYCNNQSDGYFLKEMEAKLYLKMEEYEMYETLMKQTINYFYDNKLWKYVEKNATDFALYYQEKRYYKQAVKYLQLALEASKNLCGRGF